MSKPLATAIPALVRFLYTHNPFYLIGTLLVLFGVQQCLGREPSLATSGLLVAVLAAYTLLLATIAAVVIRIGQVWDDARTILLVIVLLFFMLSTSLDFHLLFTLEAPWPGTKLLVGGLLFCVLLSEMVLHGLRIGLPAVYRGPYYLVLLLLFGYPIALGWMNYYSYYESLTWALFLFPAAAAATLLTLLPAARIPPWREPKTGTPWRWPFYPWSLFVYLTVGLAIRAWWLTIAFEPAKGPDAYFRPYFLLPLAFVWAVLILEMGIARRLPQAVVASLAIPLAGVLSGFPGPPQNAVEAMFLDRLVSTIGSPPQLMAWGLVGFYSYCWLRGIRAAEGFLVASGLFASLIDGQTLDWSALNRPNPLVIAVVAGALLGLAIHRNSTWRAVAGAILAAMSLSLTGAKSAMTDGWFWQWHVLPLALLAIAVFFNDELAKALRQIGWRAVPLLALGGALVYPWALPTVSTVTLTVYFAVLLGVSAAFWLRERRVELLVATLTTFAGAVLAQLRQTYAWLDQTAVAGGLPWLATGMLVVAAAFVISLLKMGAWAAAWRGLRRINVALAGSESLPT